MRIAQVLTDKSHWGEIGPETLGKGLGGRETALVSLAQEWAKEGHEVINFVPRREIVAYQNPLGGEARYVPVDHVDKALPIIGTDALVLWECPEIVGAPGIREMSKFVCVEMQVAHISINEATMGDLDDHIDKWCVLSEWAGDFLKMQSKYVESKLVVHPNGVNIDRWAGLPLADHDDADPKFFYSSSPDRGLAGLLRAWPLIREKLPNATLDVAYGIEKWAEATRWSHGMQCEDALTVIEGINQPGVNYHGKIGQDELALIQAGSHGLLYPCDPYQPTETGCITAVEAGASDSMMILSDADCLKSEFGECSLQVELPLDPQKIADTAVSGWEDKELRIELCGRGRELAESRDWELIARGWLNMFREEIE